MNRQKQSKIWNFKGPLLSWKPFYTKLWNVWMPSNGVPQQGGCCKSIALICNIEWRAQGKGGETLICARCRWFFLSYTLTSANKITVHVILIVGYEAKARPLRRLKVLILKWPIPWNQPFLSTLCKVKIRGIGHRSIIIIRKISENDKINTFSHLSGINLLTNQITALQFRIHICALLIYTRKTFF